MSLSFCLIGVKPDGTGILSNRDRDDFGRNSGLISSEHQITETGLLFFQKSKKNFKLTSAGKVTN